MLVEANLKTDPKLSVVVQACSPSTWEAEAGELSHPGAGVSLSSQPPGGGGRPHRGEINGVLFGNLKFFFSLWCWCKTKGLVHAWQVVYH
jgi:hypothetical protein